ncbi:hypothetical protein [Hyphobacterium sp.]|jgi:hypothetical protein|uniref:hypothetical protein n=1 Tax=Hyphobacterium sp. TaxID=2004662 RepID=UPI003BAD5700
MRFLPYAIGVFMLSPLFIWAGLWMAFPGPKPGISDAPLIASLIAMSIPLVLYHYIAGLAFIANSIEGYAGTTRPRWAPARWVQHAMMPATLLLTASAAILLHQIGKPWPAIGLTVACGAVLAIGLAKADGFIGPLDFHRRSVAFGLASVRILGRIVLAVPVLGSLLREFGRDPHRAAPFALATLAMATALLVWQFGFVVLVIPAMIAAPVAFYLMLGLASD